MPTSETTPRNGRKAAKSESTNGGTDGIPRVRAVYRTVSILDALRESPNGASLAILAERVALPKSSTLRYLITLESAGYVDRDTVSGHYRLGLAFLQIEHSYRDALAARVRPYLESARDQFDETINFGILDGNRVAYLEIVESSQSLRLAARPGDRAPLHSTAMGKAMAANLPDEEVRRILAAEGMPKRTPKTITSVDKFMAQLAEVQKQGYAVDIGEDEDGSRCVAVALPVSGLSAAISLSAPAFRFSDEEAARVAEVLRRLGQQMAEEIWSAGDEQIRQAAAAAN